MNKACVVCGREFDARGTAKTCGDVCSREWANKRRRERSRERYHNDLEYRERMCKQRRELMRERMQDPELRQQILKRMRERMRERMQDPEYRERERERKRESDRLRMQDPKYRKRKRETSREWYLERRNSRRFFQTLAMVDAVSK